MLMQPFATGSLDRWIVIQRTTTSTNAFNEKTNTWNQLTRVPASADPISDGERLQGSGQMSNISMRFTIRWSTAVKDVDTRDRVVFDGRTYDIAGVKEIGRRGGLEITAAARGERT